MSLLTIFWDDRRSLTPLQVRACVHPHRFSLPVLNKPTLAEHTCLMLMSAAAFFARKLGATFAFIDCPDGRNSLFELTVGEEYPSAHERLTAEALGESLAACFRLWAESDPAGPDQTCCLLQ
jgi:hypothetical protein